ncbi:hypothetical protein BDV33DRAFT_18022 [Aspergillus novoparasiticus]|uniref:Uncharacterized protein n=1 Tax=Aspergillus novoparasiticus TaxID=986946 RepID=A0A5N6F4F9_9EURO|nr:hypothetical protein BDV33DRAFT_18022 [Aspergillus novoparasiticus]
MFGCWSRAIDWSSQAGCIHCPELESPVNHQTYGQLVSRSWKDGAVAQAENKLSAASGVPSRHGDLVAMMAMILCLPNDSYNSMEGLLPIGNTIWWQSNIGDHGANSFRRAKAPTMTPIGDIPKGRQRQVQESGVAVLLLERCNEAYISSRRTVISER